MSRPEAPRSAPAFAIVLLSVAAFASAANMRVIDPLLVQLGLEFGVTVGAASVAATAFLLANGVFVLVHGPFGDRHGKMPVVAIACLAAAGWGLYATRGHRYAETADVVDTAATPLPAGTATV